MTRAECTTLSNGVRVATCEMPHMQTAAVGIWAAVGGRNERASQNGISHFVEHLLFKGTKRRSARQISEAVEGVGGYLNAYTSEEHTCYHASALADHFEGIFEVLADMYRNARFAEQDIERERGVICEEILMYRDEPSQHVQELLTQTLWPDHALGRPLTGTLETVNGLSRDDLVAFRDRNYSGKSTVVTAAGRIRHEQVVKAAREHFGHLPPGTARRRVSPPENGLGRVAVELRDTEQTQVALAFPAYGSLDPRRFALNVLGLIIGGNMSSRLFQTLRERRGLCYSVGSHYATFRDTGAINVSLGLDAKNLARALKLMRLEFQRLRERAVPVAELGRAKDYALGTSRISLEKTSSQNARLGCSMLTYGRLVDPEEMHERLRAVTSGDLLEVAHDVLKPGRAVMAVVGPTKESSQQLQDLLSE